MKRRDVLKATGTSLTAGVALAGQASAKRAGPARAKFDPVAARSALGDNQELLEELADDGVIEDASLDHFDVESEAAVLNDDGVGVTKTSLYGTRTKVHTVSRSVEAGTLTINVVPGTDDAFAVLDTGDGLETYGPDPLDNCGECWTWECYCAEYDSDWNCVDRRCNCEPDSSDPNCP